MKALVTVLLFAFACPLLHGAETAEVEIVADPRVYGEYPKDYQTIITNWLQTKLLDPASAQIEWLGPPKPAELPGPKGKRLSGYLVEFKVNSRNRFGTYTGMQKKGALIRDGAVIKATGFF
jgi:hypothetical protein